MPNADRLRATQSPARHSDARLGEVEVISDPSQALPTQSGTMGSPPRNYFKLKRICGVYRFDENIVPYYVV
jgi:hypothetical protein